MLKKFLLAAIVGLIICAGVKVEAAEIFVGTSPATGDDCYVLTHTIDRTYEDRMVVTSVRLKTTNRYGDLHYIDYTFYAIDGGNDNVQFVNSDGFKGVADPYDTPIEWAAYTVTKDY